MTKFSDLESLISDDYDFDHDLITDKKLVGAFVNGITSAPNYVVKCDQVTGVTYFCGYVVSDDRMSFDWADICVNADGTGARMFCGMDGIAALEEWKADYFETKAISQN